MKRLLVSSNKNLIKTKYSSINKEIYFNDIITHEMKWQKSDSGTYPYFFKKGNDTFQIRVNDFPSEPLYTVLHNDQEIGDIENWPSDWLKPT